MMICGTFGNWLDGAADFDRQTRRDTLSREREGAVVLACKRRMFVIAQEGRVPVISAMGNLPIVKDLVVDMEPFWDKFKAIDPYLQPGYQEPPDGKEHLIRQERMNVIHKEALCINCGCCVSECNAM